MDKQTHVLILCFNRLLRESVTRILSKRSDFHVAVAHAPVADSYRELVEASADVVVLDSMQLFGDSTIFGPDHREQRSVKCVLVAMQDDPKLFLTAIRFGALGYVLHDASAVEVVNAVRKVAQGEAVCPSQYARVLFDYFALQTAGLPNSRAHAKLCLTRREQQLVPLIDRGLTNKEIASHLSISEQTVKNHVHRILRKVGAPDRLGIFEAFQTRTLGL